MTEARGNQDQDGPSDEPGAVPAPAPYRGPERRASERQISVYRSALLIAGDEQGLCMIRNISRTGMMGEVRTALPAASAVTIAFGSGCTLAGDIVWRDGPRFGMVFDRPIDVFAMLNSSDDGNRMKQRSPRIPVRCRAVLLVAGRQREVAAVNISQDGMCIAAGFLRVGQEVVVAVPGLPTRRGVVRWCKDGHAGLACMPTIPVQELSQWADRHRPSG